ncbi:probable polygalacturonase At1g80170 isoform X2 [Rosa chinensis]|uniref:probable polygalacturonase At1g80170 isoform X2 n=1 Tax=Rosa chinensis TaxID=74649 RepID=UPI001AD91AE6|nr:probable polygalacturonase At1g80170 isoform X2 [Rosa chinensis]
MKTLRFCSSSSSSSSTCLILLLHIFSLFLSSNTTPTTDREKFDSLLRLPQSGSTRTRHRSKRVLFVGDFGAKGDGITDDSQAFKNAWEVACSIPTRTRILIPSGRTYLIHPVDIAGPCRSKVTLMISGTIIAPINPDAWIGLNRRKWLYFHGVNHLTIEGGGTVDGMGQEWWARSSMSTCSNGDDCISIVSNSSRIRIVNIVCGPGHGISIGSLGKSNSWSHVRDVAVDAAFLSNTENGVRIKTWQGGSGFASNIAFRNVVMDNVSNPIIIDQYYCDSQLPCLNQTLAVKVENISFIHIKGTSATDEAIRFACSDDSPCEGLYLEDIQLLPSNGEITRSFCWAAQGSSLGSVDPPACFSDSEEFIKQKVLIHPVSLEYGGKAIL